MYQRHLVWTLPTQCKLMGQTLLVSSLLCLASHATEFKPSSYDMPNGGGGVFAYQDDSYDGTGNRNVDYAPLSGGVGQLTDDILPTRNWNAEPQPYVGWNRFLGGPNPLITFRFDETIEFNEITILFDDANGSGGVRVPDSLTVNGLAFPVVDPPGSDPTSQTFDIRSLAGTNILELQLLHGSVEWVMVGEVDFFGELVPEPSSLCLLALAGFLVSHRNLRRYSIVALFCLVTLIAQTHDLHAAEIQGLFPTGYDASGSLIAPGTQDAHYQILETGTQGIRAEGCCGWILNDASSTWIWENANTQPINVTRTFRTTFSLAGLDPSTAEISGTWATDNAGLDILINGNSTGNTSPTFSSYSDFSINSGFQVGLNTLDFIVRDFGGGAGFRVDTIVGTANVIPEPSTMVLLCLGSCCLTRSHNSKKN